MSNLITSVIYSWHFRDPGDNVLEVEIIHYVEKWNASQGLVFVTPEISEY